MIPRATAKITFQRMANFGFAGVGIVLEQIGSGHDHAGGAKATLQAMFFAEAFLNGVKLTIFGQAFDGGHVAAFGLYGQGGTGFYGLTVHQHGTGTATTGITANVCTREPQCIPEVVHQQLPRLDFAGVFFPVNAY